MEVKDAETAREWLRAWGPRAFTLNRLPRIIQDKQMCAGLCRPLQPVRASEFEAAVEVFRNALEQGPNEVHFQGRRYVRTSKTGIRTSSNHPAWEFEFEDSNVVARCWMDCTGEIYAE